jgi:hypothetical protein
MPLDKRLSFIFLFVLVCRIFSFEDGCGQQSTENSINGWLEGKVVKYIVQSTGQDNTGRKQTYITIIAEKERNTL